jgi:hypothetical protein
MIDELNLDVEHAEALIEAGIEFEVFTEEMPDSDADKIEAAHEIVAMAIDSWVDDEVRPDSEDEQTANAGEQIKQILDIAGIEIDEGNAITFGELPELVDPEDGDGEVPFSIDDVIDGYDDMNVADITAAMNDLDDDDIEAVKEYEKTEGRKRAAILKFVPDDAAGDNSGDDDEGVDLSELDRKQLIAFAKEQKVELKPRGKSDDELRDIITEALGGDDEAGDDDGDGDGEDEGIDLAELDRKQLIKLAKDNDVELKPRGKSDDEIRAELAEAFGASDDDGDGDDTSDDGEEPGEPWDGYDGSSVKEIKDALEAAREDTDEPLTAEQVAYVSQYESSREKPRSSLVKWLDALAEEMGAPASDDEAGDAVDDAVAKDDRKDKRAAKAGKLVLTREQILEALAEGSVTLD